MDELLNEITPLPWLVNASKTRVISGEPPANIGDPDVVVVADSESKAAEILFNQTNRKTKEANIRYIVRACNAYPALRAVAKEFVALFRECDMAPEGGCRELYAKALEALGQEKGAS